MQRHSFNAVQSLEAYAAFAMHSFHAAITESFHIQFYLHSLDSSGCAELLPPGPTSPLLTNRKNMRTSTSLTLAAL